MSTEHKNEILPGNVVPTHYNISIETIFDTLTFLGNEEEQTSTIVLNSLGLKINSARVGDLESSSIVLNEEGETATLTFPKDIGAVGDEVTLALTFSGELDGNMRGYYKSKHEVDGKTQWIGATQFEPVDARRAFPSWDEPALKATFAITLIAPKDMVTLSNMPEKSITDLDNGRKRVDFHNTPLMSTYLVAYVVGHFECVEGALKSGSKVRVWAVPGKRDQCHFALQNGIQILEYYENYYGIAYPLPKTDMIALPDFQMGAMENWGLITYRETALLCNPETASVAAKSRVVYVIAHELAHQWFGNLVTPAWWKQLWLNEGFASFVGAQATAHFYPEWRYWDQFVVSYINSGLKADAARTSHPIEVEISVARSVQEIFDTISYQKGASVIKMISNFLGEEVFQKGLHTYLSKFAYGNTVTKDLWDHLSLASGKDVSLAMDNWVKEMGYPVVTIEETSEKGKFKFSQRRFLGYGLPTEEENRVTWNVNIGVITESHRDSIQYVTLDQKDQIITLPVNDSNEWVKINAGQSGFYRAQYSPELAKRLTAALKANVLTSTVDRLGLVNDVFSLAFAGTLPLSQALELAAQYTDETDAIIWGILADNLSAVCRLFEGSEIAPLLRKYMLNLFGKIGATIGWEIRKDEDELWKSTRPRILDILGEYGDESILAECRRRKDEYEKDNSSLPIDLAGLVFKYWLRNSDAEAGKRMIEIYEKAAASTSSSPEWVIKTLACIGYSTDIEGTLKHILESDAVRPQDFMYPLNAVCSTLQGREAAWKFIQSNWEQTNKKVSASLLNHVITICTGFHSTDKLREVEEFFASRTTKEMERTVKNRLEAIKTNINTLDKQTESTVAYFKQNYSS